MKLDEIQIIEEHDVKTIKGYRGLLRSAVVFIDDEYLSLIKVSAGGTKRTRIFRGTEAILLSCDKCEEVLPPHSFWLVKGKPKGACISCSKKYYTDNHKRYLDKHKEANKRNHITKRVFSFNGRAKKFGAEDVIQESDLITVIERFTTEDKKECAYCSRTLDFHDSSLHADHFISLAMGGTNKQENITVCCSYCNMGKRNKDFFEWSKDYFGHNSLITPYQVQKRMVDYFKEHYNIDYSNRINVQPE
ncbi:HNH endonuclease [Peribacillus muralis]|uniref:HNH endonuclease n=1 Tax=Peribacillus muralis TaxID=264697 RepID=UPI00366C6D0E